MKLSSVFIFLFICQYSQAVVHQVCLTCKQTSIQAAIKIAKPFDVIEVASGSYPVGMLIVDKPLTLRGTNKPTLDGLKKQNVIHVLAPNVIIEGFRIIGCGSSDIAEYAGVRVEEVDNCQIKNNVFDSNVYSVYLAKSDNCLIEGNTMSSKSVVESISGNGIHMWNSKHIRILKNKIQGHRDGIYIEFSTDSLIQGNVSTHNIRYGLHFMYSHRNHYIGNDFIDNQTGVAVMFSKNIEMTGNRFQKSWGRASYGLLLKDISDSNISGNNFEGNTVGVLLDAANRNRFFNNTLKQNGWALTILGNSDSNIFSKNKFISNFFDATTNAQVSQNTFQNNYWSAYRGYDLNHDGIGDQPFRPMKMFGRWVARFPELVALLGSPVIEFLEVAERVFPVLTPTTFVDPFPLMRQP